MVTQGVWAYLCVQENETLSVVLTDGANIDEDRSSCNASAREATLYLVSGMDDVDIIFFFGGVSMCGRKRWVGVY